MTDAERKLWLLLRDRRLHNHKFRRQHPVEKYILDFACIEAHLVIEIDGGQHCENIHDQQRTAWLEKHGWHVIRFWNSEVMTQNEAVLETIIQQLGEPPHPPLSPSKGARV